jgi:hypothetical protein
MLLGYISDYELNTWPVRYHVFREAFLVIYLRLYIFYYGKKWKYLTYLYSLLQRHYPFYRNWSLQNAFSFSSFVCSQQHIFLRIFSFKLYIMGWLAHLLHIKEVPGSNLGLKTGFLLRLSWYSSVLPGKCRDNTLN